MDWPERVQCEYIEEGEGSAWTWREDHRRTDGVQPIQFGYREGRVREGSEGARRQRRRVQSSW